MARNVGVSVENAFNKGLVTEVTGVNSPENSVLDTLNMSYDRRGRAIKRKGFEYEDDFKLEPIAGTSGVFTEFLWQVVSSNFSQDFVVIQTGGALRFYSVSSNSTLSRNLKSFSVNLTSYRSPNFTSSQVSKIAAQYTTGRGYLFVAHPYCDTIYIEYNPSTDSITVNKIDIRIRDIKGIDEGVSVDNRPTSLTAAHKYNLYNQGWYAEVYISGDRYRNALDHWDTERPDFPSNVDVWWYYASVTRDERAIEYLNIDRVDARTSLYGNTPAPKGHYILNPFRTGRTDIPGIGIVKEQSSNGLRPSVVAFYAGRVFYAGVGQSGYSSLVYFSQIIESDEQMGKCYQANDPTSRELFDLLDTDGGVIDIQDINTVYDLRVVGDSLYVFASNGVWSISGTDSGPFRATDYSISKITSEAAISRLSIVEVSGSPIWWNYEGIFTLKKSEIGLTTDVTNITATTIQSFYDDIPQPVKASAKGAYNSQSNLVYWLYSSNSRSPTSYTHILVMDALTLAFYVFSLPQGDQRIRGVVSARSTGPLMETDPVTTTSDSVVTLSGDPVVVDVSLEVFATSMEFKFITTLSSMLTFSEIKAESHLDWNTYDYSSYFKTGYRVRGELIKKSQTNYLTIFMETDIDASCMVQPIWDYSNTTDSGRYGNPQQAYKHSLSDYSMRRLKMRGSGISLQFHFFGERGKPMTIIGWAGYETSNGAP